MRLDGKVAVLTGACGGIGRAIVRTFVAEGARVVVADLRAEELAGLEAQYPGTVSGVVTDVTRYEQVQALIDAAVERFGTLDVVMNNAGIGEPVPLLQHDAAEHFDRVTAVNQKGVYHGIVAAGRKFVALGKRGVIINTSSVYGRMASELTFTYNVSKAAVDMMTKCAALEFAPHGIRVCAVAPGRVDTPLLRKYEALGLWEHIRKEQMRQAFTTPDEIAALFAFLASDEANVVNGTTVAADDGFLNFKYPLLDAFAA